MLGGLGVLWLLVVVVVVVEGAVVSILMIAFLLWDG